MKIVTDGKKFSVRRWTIFGWEFLSILSDHDWWYTKNIGYRWCWGTLEEAQKGMARVKKKVWVYKESKKYKDTQPNQLSRINPYPFIIDTRDPTYEDLVSTNICYDFWLNRKANKMFKRNQGNWRLMT